MENLGKWRAWENGEPGEMEDLDKCRDLEMEVIGKCWAWKGRPDEMEDLVKSELGKWRT
jgi:hypothetical protein